MSIFKGLAKIAFSPLRIAKEVVDDISGENSDVSQGMSILTLGASSVVKGAGKAIKEASDEIFE